ncbi:hypothetical protein HLI26_07305 [Salmonella enterica subsp. enterica]|uniref:hypothetical protein n=1 Tax=Salmonella enterica TaxID=28901 RepID=UPI002151E9A1|nr:hypothetical protein [Salmonella enterica]MCR6026787.1 hypothetical protein [Salmonella enterica subsp. enterica]
MSNNDELALKEKFEAWAEEVGALPWGHLKKQRTKGGGYSVQVYTYMWSAFKACNEALLAERDADKKQLAAMSQAFLNLKLLADVYLHAYEESKASVAEQEARTVSVKLLDCDFAAVQHMSGGSNDYCNGFVDGTQNAIKCFKADLAAAGINLEVGE